MKVLFDNGTPKPIARALPDHDVTYARRIGWHELRATPAATGGSGTRKSEVDKVFMDVGALLYPPRGPWQRLRHTVATLAYRAEKVLRDVPDGFATMRVSENSRTPTSRTRTRRASNNRSE